MAKEEDKDRRGTGAMTGYSERGLNYLTCPKHGTRYMRGGQCPKCAAEQQRG